MRFRGFVALCLAVYLPCAEAASTVGAGAPDASITQAFVYAWGRGAFNHLVGDPTDNVTSFGASGLIQHFPSATNSAQTLALIKPDLTDASDVVQMQAAMYAYYSTQAVGTVGYPTDDTQTCPGLKSLGNTLDSCQWQPLTKNYVLFVYAQPVYTGGQNFATRDPFYTKWNTLGGVSMLGPATSAEATSTSTYGSTATYQTYDQGAIYNITAGLIAGRLLTVKEPVYDLYFAQGAQGGSLGLPTTDELTLPNGMVQQTFEGGAIQYNPATGIPVLLPGVASISLSPMGPLHLNQGDTASLTATLVASNGSALTDRVVTWNTSNGQVAQIQANGQTATLKAVGGGAASITASSGGKTSAAVLVTVVAPCCQIGEGAPTAAIQLAFQNAVARNQLQVQLPAASPVVRIGAGYAQQLSGNGMSYLVTVADGSGTGYVVAGTMLAAYNGLGGPAGTLGYPLGDATPGGRQNFQKGALAGSPVVMVGGAILAKWASLGYETGVAGLPLGPAASFQTFAGTSGVWQTFAGAAIVNPTVGKNAGQAFAITGVVLSVYNSQGGIAGDLGAPVDNETSQRQDFEGGTVEYGGGTALVLPAPRTPSVTATPSSVIVGAPIHLVVGGFANGATVRVSVTGQPDFLVTVPSGAYVWDALAGSAGTVTVKAVDTGSSASASATYTVKTAAAAGLTVSIVSGDQQMGAPGAQLTSALLVVVKDANGNPVPGQTVIFAASPGGSVSPASAVTAANGQASTAWRMPPAEGIALATAALGKSVVTFSAKSAAFSLTNFPVLSQNVPGTLGNGPDTIASKGALLTAAASILRYHQQRGEMPQPNGLADPVVLNSFLKSYCVGATQVCDGFLTFGGSSEQTVNLWRLAAFVGGSVDVQVQNFDMNAARDLIASGSPVLIPILFLPSHPIFTPTGMPAGSHYVVANGIAADGSVLIADPAGGATSLNAYLGPVASTGGAFTGNLISLVRLAPQASRADFLVAANSPISVNSVSGACANIFATADTAAILPLTASATPGGMLWFQSCDGARDTYEIDFSGQGTGYFTDLSPNGSRIALGGSSLATRSGSQWTIGPITTGISASGVINSASGTAAIAPGGFVTIYGTGLAGTSSVTINGEAAGIVATTPFLVNAVIPMDAAPGPATLSVISPHGSALQSITIAGFAPAIFTIGNGQAAITNQDNSLNTPANPAVRGSTLVIYGTGFGAVSPVMPVSAVIGGVELKAAFAGLTPGVPGLYQANVPLPATLAPGLALPLYLKQGGAVSNTVTVAIQ
jgi:uncharacterized protein (TIGR03437 family)